MSYSGGRGNERLSLRRRSMGKKNPGGAKRRQAVVLLAALFAIYCAAQLIDGIGWINRVYPGFFVHANLMVAGNTGRDLGESGTGLGPSIRVLAVNDIPVSDGAEFNDLLQGMSVGQSVSCLVQDGGRTVEKTVRTRIFSARDFVLLAGTLYVTGLVYLALGLGIVLSRPSTRQSIPFVVLCITIGVYFVTAFNFLTDHHFDALVLMAACFAPASLLHMGMVFPRQLRALRTRPWVILLPYAFSTVLLLVSWRTFYSMPFLWATLDNSILVYLLLGVVFLVWSCGRVLRGSTHHSEARKAKIVLLGVVGGFFLPVGGMVAARAFIDASQSYNYLLVLALALPASLCYAIVRHNLFDVDRFIKRTVEYVTLTAVVGASYLGVLVLFNSLFSSRAGDWLSRAFLVGAMLTVALVLNPVRIKLQAAVNSMFFKRSYDARRMISELSAAMTHLMELDEILNKLLDTVATSMFIESGHILLHNAETDSFYIAASYGDESQDIPPITLTGGHPVVRRLEEVGQPISLSDLEKMDAPVSARIEFLHACERLSTELLVPLITKDEASGFLLLGAKKSGEPYSRGDIELLMTLANQSAISIENARAFDIISQRAKQLQTIQNIGMATAATLNLGRLFEVAAKLITENLGFDAAAILRHDSLVERFVRGAAVGYPEDLLAALSNGGVRLDPGKDILAQVVRERKTMLTDSDDALRRGVRLLGRTDISGPTIATPMAVGNQTVGVLVVGNPVSKRPISAGSTKILQTLAAQVGIAVRNAASYETIESILESLPSCVLILNSRLLIEFANSVFQETFGRSQQELVGRNLLDVIKLGGTDLRSLVDEIDRFVEDTNPIRNDLEVNGRIFEYHLFHMAGVGGPKKRIGLIMNDVTERNRWREELFQAEKMSAIGEVVSGVAHELNNPLTAVLGYAQLLGAKNTDEKTKRRLSLINTEALRCKRIVDNLLGFVRKREIERMPVDVNEVVSKTLELVNYRLQVDGIDVAADLAPDLLKTHADFYQLEQVFLNVVNNAHQAMVELPDGKERKLFIHTEARGKTILTRFIDTGPGIDPVNVRRIFEPFFTTKLDGKGTGLGLSVSYGIIKSHGGEITVKSRPGFGTTFTVALPVTQSATSSAQTAEPQNASGTSSKQVLVVDDEEHIRLLLQDMLVEAGHRVDEAADGADALQKMRDNRYDVVICDIKMPCKDGPSLYAEVEHVDPSLAKRFVFCTGDSISQETQQFLQNARRRILRKPFEYSDVIGCLDA